MAFNLHHKQDKPILRSSKPRWNASRESPRTEGLKPIQARKWLWRNMISTAFKKLVKQVIHAVVTDLLMALALLCFVTIAVLETL